MGTGNISGNVNFTADGAVIRSGEPVRVWNAILVTGANATVKLYDGTSASGTLIDTITAAANNVTRVNYENGKLFKSGCFADVTGTITACNLECTLEL